MVTKLSVFLPAYNESENLPFLIDQCDRFLSKSLKQYEIIVVNDGSIDSTSEVVAKLEKKYPHLRLVNHPSNLGYGQAIRTGIRESRYPWVFFMDSDNQFHIEDLSPFFECDDYDLVIGYRIKRDDPFTRLLASRIYGLFVKTLFGLRVRDIDCAFKMMKKEAVENLKTKSDSFFISTELLVRAAKKGLKIKEIGVHHYPRKEGKSTVTFARMWHSLVELKKLYASTI